MTDHTSRLSLPFPEDTEPADGPAAIGALATAIDPLIPPFSMGVIGTRPAAGLAGRLYYATDESLLYLDNGSAWLVLNAPMVAEWKTGDMKFTGRDDLEAGWLWARGQNESRTAFAALFAEYGTTYGPGDGSTTFGMPDARGRVLVGLDTGAVAIPGAGTLGAKGGSKEHTLTAAQSGLVGHTHGVSDPGHYHQLAFTTGAGGSMVQGLVPPHNATVAAANVTERASTGVAVQAAAAANASQAHNNIQPFCAVNVIVKT